MSITASLKAFFTSIISFMMSQFRPNSDPPPFSRSIDDTEAQPAAGAANKHTKMSITTNLRAFFTSIKSFIMSQLRPSSDLPLAAAAIDDPEAQPAAGATNTPKKMSISSSIRAFFTSIKSFIMSQLRPSSDPPPAAAAAIVEQQNPNQFLLQWENVVMAFCFTSATQIATLSAQTKSPLSVSFNLLSFVILIIFLLIFVAISVGHKFTVTSQVLKKVAIFLSTTSIILAITIPFPLWLKCTAWVLYALSLFIVVTCNKF